jgi:DNA-binding NarL/FixJ family response regulator
VDDYVYTAVQAGACGFLLKDVSPDDLVHAVRSVARGDVMLAPVLTRRLLERFAAAPPEGAVHPIVAALPERERQVLTLIARGGSNQQIAATLFLGESTVNRR